MKIRSNKMYVKAVLFCGMLIIIVAPTLILAWFIAAITGYVFLKAIGG